MLTETMVTKLIKLYNGEDGKKKIIRKECKIVVDSLVEQLCNNCLQMQPNGIANIRKKINSYISQGNASNVEILQSFDKVLRSYSDAFSKSYSDHTDHLNSFLGKDLKEFVLVLINNNYIGNTELKDELEGLLQ